MHVVGSSGVLDVPGLIVVSGPDGQGLLMEVPNLLSSTIGGLDGEVSVVLDLEVSVVWQL